jgi:hypothetical protein
MDSGSEFGAQETRICCLISKPTHGSHAHVDRPGRKTAFLGRNLRAAFAQKADGSHFALTVLFQAGRVMSSRRWALRTRSNVSVYTAPSRTDRA